MTLADWERAMETLKARRYEPFDRHTPGQTRFSGDFQSENYVDSGNLAAEVPKSTINARTETMHRIVACLEQNRNTVQWVSLRILQTNGHKSAEQLRYAEILDEYDSLIDKAQYVREQCHLARENMIQMLDNERIDRLQLTLMQVLKDNFIMRNFINTMYVRVFFG
ncbi:hypothetical protein Daus18300_010779 [Diaporthe australafricana]|uniref:Uncharacterized protein n=1 Tax=Diaporthe australafricana TaxID=127596 RepID=A0ABR3W9B3_9PEZI